jgi:5S rRNA maturation endonuclease (ribonuclease M5)
MNSYQAKKLNLPEIMARLGYQPLREDKGGLEYWYSSPFRAEKEASFHTTYKGDKWIWNDFGDSGGTVIDFILRHENYSSVSQALKFLDDLIGRVGERQNSSPSFSFHQQPKTAVAVENFRDLELVSAKSVSNSVIFRYLTEERGIAFDLIKPYLKEVRYKNLKQGKEFFAFGTENIAGGYEIRAASDKFSFKSALVERQLTFFEGTRPELGIVDVFEGTTDFLSLLTMMNTDRLTGDVVIMNSISNYQNVLEFIQEKGYKSVNLFLDNDKGGHKTTSRFVEDLGAEIVHNQSSMFFPHIDVNAALLEGKTADVFRRR